MRTAPQVLIKAETESYRANFDFSEVLTTGETVSSSVVTAVPATLTIGTPSHSGAVVQVRLSGGTGNDEYAVTCVAQTSLGNTIVGVGCLIVEDV